MTVYARGDIASVSISASHGGCGATHTRPVEKGAPAKLWELSCLQCEDHLRADSLWSATMSEIPETPDEKAAREDFDKRGAHDRDQVLALALAKLAGVQLPETLLRPLTGHLPHIPEKPMLCVNSHGNPPGVKYCGECGVSMHTDREQRSIASSAPADSLDVSDSSSGTSTVASVLLAPVIHVPADKVPDVVKRTTTPKPANVVKNVSNVKSVAKCPKCRGPLRAPGQRGPSPKVCVKCKVRTVRA
jgi:hypothetical protein